jgi:hypothetical protein
MLVKYLTSCIRCRTSGLRRREINKLQYPRCPPNSLGRCLNPLDSPGDGASVAGSIHIPNGNPDPISRFQQFGPFRFESQIIPTRPSENYLQISRGIGVNVCVLKAEICCIAWGSKLNSNPMTCMLSGAGRHDILGLHVPVRDNGSWNSQVSRKFLTFEAAFAPAGPEPEFSTDILHVNLISSSKKKTSGKLRFPGLRLTPAGRPAWPQRHRRTQ